MAWCELKFWIKEVEEFPTIYMKLEAHWAESVSLTYHFVLRKLYTEPSIGASHQIPINFAKWF